MTDKLCDHIEDHEWYRKEITADGTTLYLRCHECGGEWSFETVFVFVCHGCVIFTCLTSMLRVVEAAILLLPVQTQSGRRLQGQPRSASSPSLWSRVRPRPRHLLSEIPSFRWSLLLVSFDHLLSYLRDGTPGVRSCRVPLLSALVSPHGWLH